MKPQNTKNPAEGTKPTSSQGRDILAPRDRGVEKAKAGKSTRSSASSSPMGRFFRGIIEKHIQAIKETDDQILSRIYEDISLTSLANHKKLTRLAYCVDFQLASELLDIALSHESCSHMLYDTPPHNNQEHINRLTAFADACGWNILAICAFSLTFRRCVTTSSKTVWRMLENGIYRNMASLELFAEMRQLNSENLLLEKGIWEQPRPKSKVRRNRVKDHPHHWVLKEDGTANPPFFEGYLQENTDSNIFNPSDWKKKGVTKDPTLRRPRDGPCLLCNSPTPCDCVITQPMHTSLVELREYKGKGTGVRALRPFKRGQIISQFTGVLKPLDSKEDYTYSLVQESNDPENSKFLISPKRYGNWTRFINHSCDPSTAFERLTIGRHTVMGVVVKRDIAPFEEITVSYGPGYLEHMDCKCGSTECRGQKLVRIL